MISKDIVICLRCIDYSDTSQIVTVFARSLGKFSAIAKGSKRRKSSFDGPLQIFSFGDAVFNTSSAGQLANLREFEQRPVFAGLSTRMETLNSGLFAAEITGSFLEDMDPHPELFDSLVELLKSLIETKEKDQCRKLLIVYQVNLLKETGLLPLFKSCSNCSAKFAGNWQQVWFSSSSNGIICRDCEQVFSDKFRISIGTASLLADISKIRAAPEQLLIKAQRLLLAHITYILGKKPRAAEYILKD